MNISESIAPMDYFEKLPEGCLYKIISKTTPADAVRATILSKAFKFVEESDEIWGGFLPFDYQEIIDRSKVPPVCNTKKELYFSLCDSPILLGKGKLVLATSHQRRIQNLRFVDSIFKSFFLDKHSGKKCFMIAPKKLIISESGNPMFWHWWKYSNSRFSKVAYLRSVHQLDIRGRIETQMLSPKTDYAAYLVFKLASMFHGLDNANSIIRFVNYESDAETEKQANTVKLATSPKVRGDGWMEVELGYFNSKEGIDGPVEARLMEIKRLDDKSGLIVGGIEFRPKIIKCWSSEADLEF